MSNFDIKRVLVSLSSPRHSRHLEYQGFLSACGQRRFWHNRVWAGSLTVLTLLVVAAALALGDRQYLAWTYEQQSVFQNIRIQSLAKYNELPVEDSDPKGETLGRYLAEKKSPLVEYAGLISRLPTWKLLLGIAHAESNLCKKTNRNNCWGIGPGSPWQYEDIAQSLYYANYLLTKFEKLGMKKPETLVRTYVGYYHPGWINAVKDVFYELEQRGLQ